MPNKKDVYNSKELRTLIQKMIIEESAKLQEDEAEVAEQEPEITIDNIFEHFTKEEVEQAIQEVLQEQDDMTILKQKSIAGAPKKMVQKPKMDKALGTKQHIGNAMENSKWLKGKPSGGEEVSLTGKPKTKKLNVEGEKTDNSTASGSKFNWKNSSKNPKKQFKKDQG